MLDVAVGGGCRVERATATRERRSPDVVRHAGAVGAGAGAGDVRRRTGRERTVSDPEAEGGRGDRECPSRPSPATRSRLASRWQEVGGRSGPTLPFGASEPDVADEGRGVLRTRMDAGSGVVRVCCIYTLPCFRLPILVR